MEKNTWTKHFHTTVLDPHVHPSLTTFPWSILSILSNYPVLGHLLGFSRLSIIPLWHYDIIWHQLKTWKHLETAIFDPFQHPMGGQGSGSVRSGTLIPIKKDVCTLSLMTTTPATCWMFSVFSPEPWDLLASLLIKFQDESRLCQSETTIFVVCLVLSVTCFILFSSLQKLRYSTPIYFSNFFRPYEGMGQPPTWRQPLTLWMVWTLWMAWMDWTVARP